MEIFFKKFRERENYLIVSVWDFTQTKKKQQENKFFKRQMMLVQP